jgi:hypothetical protein
MVWKGYICELTELKDWEEDKDLAGCCTEWLRSKLRRGEG